MKAHRRALKLPRRYRYSGATSVNIDIEIGYRLPYNVCEFNTRAKLRERFGGLLMP